MAKCKKLNKVTKNKQSVKDDIDYYKNLADKNLKELWESEGDSISPNERRFISKVKEKYYNAK